MSMNSSKIKFYYIFLCICCIFGSFYDIFPDDADVVSTTGDICIGDINDDGSFEVKDNLGPVEIDPSDNPDKLINKIVIVLFKYMKETEKNNDYCLYLYKIGDDLVEDIYRDNRAIEKNKITNVDFCFVLAKSCKNKIVLKYNIQEFSQWQKEKMLYIEDVLVRGAYTRQSRHKTFSYLHKQLFHYVKHSIFGAAEIQPDDINVYINSLDEENKVNDSSKYITGEDEIIIVLSDAVVQSICRDDFSTMFHINF